MITRVPALLALVVLLGAFCRGQEEPSWRDIAPSSVELPGATLYYEESLSSQLEAIKTVYAGFRKEQVEIQAIAKSLREKRGEIVAEINAVLGLSPDDEQRSGQEKALATLFTGFSELDLEKGIQLVVIQRATSKDYLRNGGKLPGFTYDKASDRASYTLALLSSSNPPKRDEADEASESSSRAIVLPVGGPDSAADDLRDILSLITDSTRQQIRMALPVFAEGTMLKRLKAIDPYFRWFSEGFRNAIAIRLLREHVGEETAKEFAAPLDTAQFEDLEQRLNLCYWMGDGYGIDLPMASERRLAEARRAYATSEAERLIGTHGLDCVRQVLDEASGKRMDSQQLYAVVRKATGEDLEERLKRYGPLPDKDTAVARYAEQYNAALDRNDYATALPLMVRILEIRGLSDPGFYTNAAFLLFRIGQEGMGDQAILRHAAKSKEVGNTTAYLIMHKLFIDYAAKCRNLKKALPSAQIVLEADPVYVPAMVVMMLKAGEDGDKGRIRALGQQVLELEKDPQNPWRQLAEMGLKTVPKD